MGISLLQNGQIFVAGALGASSSLWPRLMALLIAFIMQNRMNAMMMKLTDRKKSKNVVSSGKKV